MNKKIIKNLTYIIASFVLVIGGIFAYTLINNKKEYFSEEDVLLAAANYIEKNDIGIGEELEIPVSLLKVNGFLNDEVVCSNDSYITVKNVDGEYIYESNLHCNNIATITNNVVYMTANTVNESIAPQIPLAYKGPTYSITSRTNKNVTITIVTNLDILDVAGWTKVNSKTISKTYSINGSETITIYAKNSVNNYREISIDVNNIDKMEPTVTGVIDGTTYTKDVSIGFSKLFNGSVVPLTAKLNGKNFENGQVVSEDGNYTLVVTDDIGNSKTVSFIVDKTAPEVTGVENGKHYKDDVTINFIEGNVTLNGTKITNGYSITANNANEGKYELVVTDVAGNKNEITFWIDITGPSVINDGIIYSPALVDGKTSADTIVTITYDEEISLPEGSDWSVSVSNPNQIYKQFNGETGVLTDVSATIDVNDLAENIGETVNINFTIDKKAPEMVGEVEYTPALTNGRTTVDTTVTITYNEAIKLGENSEWTIVEGTNNTQITRTFVGIENAETVVNETVSVSDLVGNVSAEQTINFVIDNKKPEMVGEIEYSPALTNGRTKENTTVTITYSEAINLPANWNYVVNNETGEVDNTKITRTFVGTGNAEIVINENVSVTDLVGNASVEQVINFTIDKKAPSVTNITYIPDLINGNLSTQDVIVVVAYDEALAFAPENWEFVNGTTNQITRTFTGESGKETVINDSIVVEDLVGNASVEQVINFTIDKKAPSVTDVNYSPILTDGRTSADTIVTITYDEALKVAPENWEFVVGTTNQITRTFVGTENAETIVTDNVIVKDLYENESEATKVEFTIDKKAPEMVGEIEYNPALTGENVTNVDTTVTITYNEAIKLGEGSEWTIVEGSNNTQITRTFTGVNKAETLINEIVNVSDLVGNASVDTKVEFKIDKKAPTGIVTANPSVPTKGPVILTLETDEDVIITNSPSSKVYQCEEGNNRKYCVERSENGSFSFKFKDLAGNTGRVSYDVTNIDNDAPERVGEIEYSPALTNGRTAVDTTVTITYNEAINLPANWDYIVNAETGEVDTTKITRIFVGTENAETKIDESIIVTDLAGNESAEEKINFVIDKEAPERVGEIEYSTVIENGRTDADTIVMITYSEAIKLAENSEWSIVEGSNNTKITRTFTGEADNETEIIDSIIVEDLVGNVSAEQIINFVIDKKAPEMVGEVVYTPALTDGRTDADTTVTITYSEAINLPTIDGWSYVKDSENNNITTQITKTFTGLEDKETKVNETISVTDLVGNTSAEQIINFIIDKEAPTIVGEIEYSSVIENGKTASDTTVTITYSEAIKLTENSEWAIVEGSNNTKITRTFVGTENAETEVNEIGSVSDLVGNTSAEQTINFIIDKKAPEMVGEVEYTPALTNGRTTVDTTVTITYNEAIKLGENSEWTIVEGTNNTQITRTFTGIENAETVVNETVSVIDLVGNQSAEQTINFVIDKKAPEMVGEIEYSPALTDGRTAVDTTVTITYNEAINLPANWNYVANNETGEVDNTKITRTFAGSENVETEVNENVSVTDLVGNVSVETNVNFVIDKKAPSVTNITYIPNLINGNLSTQDVIVVVTYDEALKAAPENWEFVSGTTNQITRTFTGENGKETIINESVVVEDLVGNTSTEQVINFTIDKKAPSVTDINYSPILTDGRTATDTTVTIIYDEALKAAPENWEFVVGTTNQITRTFVGTENAETIVKDNVIVKDLYENESEATKVEFTIDKKVPEIVGEIEYSPALTGENVTNLDTTVTITYNEAIKLGEGSGWTIVEGSNNTQITRTFTGAKKSETEINETVNVSDLVGNTSVEQVINFTIDKKAPTGVVTANPSVPTKGSVILTLETDEDVIITNLPSSKVYQCEEGNNRKYCVERNENGSFSFKFKDLAGNTGRVSYDVTNIDNDAPEKVGKIEYSPALKDGRTAVDTTVTITYNEAINLPANWNYVVNSETGEVDTTKITRIFVGTENAETKINESIIVTDLAGNESTEETINFTIDKEAPVGVEIIADPTNDTPAKEVTIFLIPSEKIVITNKEEDGVKLFEETTPMYMVTVTENGTFTFEFEDLVGNKGTASYEVTNIDKSAPTVQSIKYNGQEAYNFINGKTKEDITVTITYDEALKAAPENWEFVSGTTNEITRTFIGTENAETEVTDSVVVKDLVGNESEATAINFIIDKKLPVVTGEIEYSPALTNGRTATDTIVTITYSEAINLPVNWNYVENAETGEVYNTKITKTFTGVENIETVINENVSVTDLVGNASVETTINFTIDKKAPSVTNITYIPDLINGNLSTQDVIVVVTYDEALKAAPANWEFVVGTTNQVTRTFEGSVNNETEVLDNIVAEDLVGNISESTRISFKIDKKAPSVTDINYSPILTAGRTATDTTVTITYDEALKVAPENWEFVVGTTNQITRTFVGTENAETIVTDNVIVKDLYENESEATKVEFTIDKKSPEMVGKIEYNPALTGENVTNVDTTVTITYNEAIKLGEGSEWTIVEGSNNTQITRTFTGVNKAETLINEIVNVSDLVGNVSVDTKVEFIIDKKAPTGVVTANPSVPTKGSVILTLETNEDVIITNQPSYKVYQCEEGNNRKYCVERSENGNFSFKFKDLAGNTGRVSYDVTNIDKDAPERVGEIEYSPALKDGRTASDTTVTITYNEAINLPANWDYVVNALTGEADTTKITRTFIGTENAETIINESIIVTDLAGNESTEETINFTIDKEAPVAAEIIADPTNDTPAKEVTIFLIPSEKIVITNKEEDGVKLFEETTPMYMVTVTENGTFTFEFEDLVGNKGTASYEVTNIDKSAPTVQSIKYNGQEAYNFINGKTKEDITVTITYDEALKVAPENWEFVSGTTNQITRTFVGTENAETVVTDSVVVKDLVGNESEATAINFIIDKKLPVVTGEIEYSPALTNGRTATDTTVTITYSEAIGSVTNGWVIVEENKITKTFTGVENIETVINENVSVTDLVGNASVETTINFTIDKEAPVAAEIIADPTNDTPAKEVTIFLIPSEKIIITNKEEDGVKLFEETTPMYMVTVTENGTFTFEFEDLVGNKGTASYNVTNIDKKAPSVTDINYSPILTDGRTASDTTVTITYDEALKVAPENWEFVSGTTNQITRTFVGAENAETIVTDNIVVKDLVGNESVETKINFTIDKQVPEMVGKIEYSPALKDGRTAADTTVAITYSEAIGSVTNGWVIVEENKITKTFTGVENIETVINENVSVTDLVGNASVETTINFTIDKEAPVAAEIIADPTNDTPAKEVTIFLIPSEKIIITNKEEDGVKLFDETTPIYMVTVTENGTFIFEFEDLVGNKGTASYEVTNIDNTLPTVQSIKYNGQEAYNFVNGKTKEDIIVTIEYSEDIVVPNTMAGWSYAKDINNNDIKSIITKTFATIDGEEQTFSENIIVKDSAGNESAKSLIEFTIDKKAPIVVSNVQAIDASNTKNVIVTITYDEALAFAPENWEFVSGTTTQITRTYEGVENTETVITDSVIVEDLVGNVSIETLIKFIIDKKAPSVTDINYSPILTDGRTANDTIVTITYDEALKVAPANWEFVVGTTTQITRTFVGTENAETVVTDNIIVEDKIGNTSVEQVINFVIDKKVPSVSKVEYSPALTNKELSLTNQDTNVIITYSEQIALPIGWSYVEGSNNTQITKTFIGGANSDTQINENVSVSDLVGNPISEPINIAFTIDKTIPTLTIYDSQGNVHNNNFNDNLEYSDQEFGGYRVETNDETATITHTGNIKLSQLGEQSITYTVKDKAGNEQSITINVNVIDTVLPTVNFNISDKLSQNNGWYNEPIVVDIIGNDVGSGISKYVYQYTSDGVAKTGEITDLTNPKFTIDIEGKDISFVITAYDKANNIAQVSGNNYKLDKTNPTLNYTVQTKPSANDWYNTNISILVNGSDNLSGIAKLEYSYSENNGLSWTDFSELTTNNLGIDKESQGLMYKVKATDVAGNSEVYNIDGIYKLDKTKPVITVKDGENTYTDNFTIQVQANKNGKYTLPSATVTDNFDKDIKLNATVGSVDITKTGTYYVKYSATDKANNTRELTMTVEVIDTTAPTIKLNGNNPQVVTFGQAYVEQGVTIDDNLDSGLKAVISGDKVNTNKVGEYKIVYSVTDSHNNTATATRIVKVVSTDGSSLIQTTNNCESGKDCYITSGTNNYVWYSGFLWRIIKVNDDNTVKLVTEDSVSGFSYDDNSSVFKDSNVNNWLSTEFYNSLNNKDIITNGKYCVDTLMTTKEYSLETDNNTKTQEYAKAHIRYNCNNIYQGKVGLLTIDEYNILGAENSYLNTGDHFFTMTPSTNQTVWVVQTDGTEKAWYRVISTYAIRPVITISADAKISSGDGSINNPYRIESDKVAQSNDLIKTRYTGEYVKFGNQNWRIVSTDATNNSTKLIMDNYYQTNTASKDYVVVSTINGKNYASLKFGANGLYKGSYVEEYLNNVVYNDLFTNREKAALVTSKWYNSSYAKGQNPLQSLLIKNQYTEGNIGLIRVGELMSGTSSTGRVDRFTYWTGSYVDDPTYGKYAWFTTWSGATNNALNRTDIRGLRPVINIKSNISIKSGTGTANDPYILNY